MRAVCAELGMWREYGPSGLIGNSLLQVAHIASRAWRKRHHIFEADLHPFDLVSGDPIDRSVQRSAFEYEYDPFGVIVELGIEVMRREAKPAWPVS